MKKAPTSRDWLPLSRGSAGRGAGARGTEAADLPTGQAFRPAWIDFEHGIRVGNLQPHERITQILRWHLEERYTTRFVTDRWGRGVYWKWICWVPRANRDAKPVSNRVNWGCSKFFIMLDHAREAFAFGLSVERGERRKPPADYDWHRLMAQCRKGSKLDDEARRLVKTEGFTLALYGSAPLRLDAGSFTSLDQVRRAVEKAPARGFLGLDLSYAMPEKEVQAEKGADLVQAILAGFTAVAPAMNLCMDVPLTSRGG